MNFTLNLLFFGFIQEVRVFFNLQQPVMHTGPDGSKGQYIPLFLFILFCEKKKAIITPAPFLLWYKKRYQD